MSSDSLGSRHHCRLRVSIAKQRALRHNASIDPRLYRASVVMKREGNHGVNFQVRTGPIVLPRYLEPKRLSISIASR